MYSVNLVGHQGFGVTWVSWEGEILVVGTRILNQLLGKPREEVKRESMIFL